MSVVGAVAVAGCGGKSTDEAYKDDYPPLSRKIVALGGQVGRSIQNAGNSTNQQLADDFGNYAQRLGDLKQQVDDLDPPKDLDDEQAALVSALDDVQGDLNDISDAASKGDPKAARAATIQLIKDSPKLASARRALNRAVDKL
jgi:ABC-type transporter Mla subunit MlaD